MVVRQDRKPLLPLQLEILCAFCKDVVTPLVTKSMEGDSVAREAALSTITHQWFSKFFDAYRDYRADFAPEWRSLPSPYDM